MRKLFIFFLLFIFTLTLNLNISRLNASVIVNAGDFTAKNGYLYLGDPTTDGSWRLRIGTYNLQYEKRVSSAWVAKDADYHYYQQVSRTDAANIGCCCYGGHIGTVAYYSSSFTSVPDAATYKLRIQYDWQSDNCSGYDYYSQTNYVTFKGSAIESYACYQTSWVSRDNIYNVSADVGTNAVWIGVYDSGEDGYYFRNYYATLYTPNS